MKLIKAEWAGPERVYSDEYLSIIRDFMSFHVLCPKNTPIAVDEASGALYECVGNSALHWSRTVEYPWCVLNGDVRPEHTVLDAGAGHSVFQYGMAPMCQKYVSMDADDSDDVYVAYLKNKLNLQTLERVRGDILDIPFPSNHFDRVFCISVLEHIPTWRQGLQELFRVVKPGGYLLLTCDIIGRQLEQEHTCGASIWVSDVPELTFGHMSSQIVGKVYAVNFGGCIVHCLCLKYQKEEI